MGRAARCGSVDHPNKRMAITEPPLAPHWKTTDVRAVSGATAFESTLSGYLALAEGHDSENITPTAELQALAIKKQQSIQSIQQAYTDLAALFQNGVGQAFYAESTSRSGLRQLLLAEESPSYEWLQTVGISWVGSPDDLLFLRQALGQTL